MNDQLEAELREVFAICAAEVSTDAVERLRRIEYRPHVRRQWPLTISAVGAASGTAAIMSVVMLGGSQAAFAGWTATPTTATEVQSAATQGNCQGRLATVPGGSDEGSWNQVATDVRGPYAVTVYVNGSSLGSCFTGPSFTAFQAESLTAGGGIGVSLSGGSSSLSGSGRRSARSSTGVQMSSGGDIELLLVSHLSQAGNGAYTLVEGRLAPTVSAVSLVLSDGQDVTATTGSGWLVAWWPGSQGVSTAQVTSASGTTTESLIASHLPLPPAPDGTHGAPSGGSPPAPAPPGANS